MRVVCLPWKGKFFFFWFIYFTEIFNIYRVKLLLSHNFIINLIFINGGFKVKNWFFLEFIIFNILKNSTYSCSIDAFFDVIFYIYGFEDNYIWYYQILFMIQSGLKPLDNQINFHTYFFSVFFWNNISNKYKLTKIIKYSFFLFSF
jgi:hypothetical protein